MNSESARKAIGLAAALGLALAAATARAAPQPNCPDKVNANTGQTIAAPGVAVSLTASGNFDIFTWSQTKGTAATLIPANGVGKQIQFVAPIVPAGGDSLTFEVRAEKAGCPTRRDAATINVTNPVVNRAPVAVAAASPAISDPEGTLVTLDGSASYDPDGATSLTYTWEQTSGVPVTLSGATSAIATFTTPDVGTAGATLQFRLTVWDGALTSAPATVTVNVTWVNAPPVAVATCPTTVSEREPLVLDGSGSGDVDDGIAAYEWRQTFGAPIAELTDPQPVETVTLSAPSLFNGLGDSWSFELKVTDATGAFRTSACSVQVLDVTPPNVIVPGPLTEEAKGADGAPVSFSVSAMDDWSGDVSPSVVCTPASGSLFPLGTTTVTCKVKDAAGNEGSGSFDVTVRDTTPPAVTVPGNIAKVEATGPGGAPVSFTATASDLVDGPVAAACTPPSGSTFALGTTAVSCSATDAHGNTGSGSFTVEVVDTSPPVLTVPGNIAKLEATGPGGAAATFSGSASDVVDGPVAVTCNPASGSTFVLGTTTVSCSAKDAHGNEATGSFTVEVVDTTPPNLEPKDVTAEATGAAGAVVTYTVTATDLVDGPVAAACLPASGQAFPLGDTVVSCSATDAHTNRKDATFKVTVVDTTPPTVTVPANITTGPTKVGGGPATFSASAWDLVDGPVLASCDWLSNSLFPFGPTTVTCSASDAHGNVGHASFTVTVTPFTFDGFYQPVDNNGVVNAVKGGATVPIKFRLFGQGVEIKDTAAVDLSKLRAVRTNCSGSAEQTVDVTTTGGTSLRYDTTGSQFVLNWQTPKLPGTCLQLELGFVDGAAGGKVQTALFKLK